MRRAQPEPPRAQFVSAALANVSRSFALVIPMLETPLDHSVGLAYLLCRVCDNIEDCHHSFAWKQDRWSEFSSLLHHPDHPSPILDQWANMTWPGLTEGEAALMGPGGLPLWEAFAALPSANQATIRQWALEMAQGMAHTLSADAPIVLFDGVQVMRTLDDFDRYCYYVAGTVGHMCTELVAEHHGFSPNLRATLTARAEGFGRALQKTNILKDFARDRERKVCYFPATWMAEVDHQPLRLEGAPAAWVAKALRNILTDLTEAVDYVVTLPLQAVDYRLFCLRALLPAYQTLRCAASRHETLFTTAHACKIDRTTMATCMQDANTLAHDNHALLDARRLLTEAIEACLSPS